MTMSNFISILIMILRHNIYIAIARCSQVVVRVIVCDLTPTRIQFSILVQ